MKRENETHTALPCLFAGFPSAPPDKKIGQTVSGLALSPVRWGHIPT